MAISRKKKEQLVEKYVDQLKASEAVIISDYRGLTVSQLQELRGKIREAEGSFAVVKNTLARRALAEAELSVPDEMMFGPVGIGFCGNNIPGVAKAFADFAKDHEELGIKGGLMDKKVLSEDDVKSLAKLPSLDVLQAQLLGLINAPASQLVGVVSGGVRQMVNVIHAYSEQGEEAAAEAQ